MPFRNPRKLTAAVIGTGFYGICAAVQLEKELGIKAQLFELTNDVGGTWQSNTYPGAECDIPSHLYSLSFEPNDAWTKHYSGQAEIYAYLRRVAQKYNIYGQTKFETEVVFAEWKEQLQKWHLQWRNTNNHQETGFGFYDILFAGLGPLRVPNIPSEFSKFQGPIVHTTQWNSLLDYSNKKIAVIGSGATAVQAIPELRKMASHVYSYQRTPAWISPRDQFSYPRILKFVFRWFPFLMKMYRFFLFLQHETFYINFGYYNSWFSRRIEKLFKQVVAWRLKRVGRPDLIPILTPDYPVGCKRVAKSEVYLEALAKPNVTVIPSGVTDIKERTLMDKNGNEIEVDILILATGFDVQGFTGNLDIYGRNRVLLDEKWRKHFPKTYKTVTVHGYPNFFMLLGPSAALGHNSVVIQIEIQVNYAIKCIKRMLKKNLAAIEPKESAQDQFSKKLQKNFEGTVWKGGCRSWYMNDAGEIYGLWSGPVTSFW
ncbi:flavin-binding monooxygenase-like protein [Zychaea mexicana]|uniref:flavin-binding monooxygenase-like protein n=1 Tax=Zychaea mexicana TaxID=64656 RepID=UPI0022FF22B2|nr:flavin-binding monooxygenase-like protein [Zychaea mexicana]KAI9489657.1 flavin-binding monooxygenase-like protein [Zychaea mexicana]